VSIDFNIPIPLFPLNACVLLPHTTTPLHIFELRYRRMTAHALDSNGLIATATFHGDAWRYNYEGNPPIRPCVCVGYVIRHERLPDGRYNILLQGLTRAKIVEEIDPCAFRRAVLEPLETDSAMEIDLESCRDRIEELLTDPLLRQWSQVQAVSNWINSEMPTVALLDQMVSALCRCTDERYTMLAEPCPCQRAEWLHKHLVRTRKTLYRAQCFGRCVSEQGQALN
jgi:Lon protease-like protein